MKKITLAILLLSGINVFGQGEQQGIELPDFVITGKQNIEIPKAVKPKPDLITTLSTDFFLPQYSPDELPVTITTDPVGSAPDIRPQTGYYNSSLIIQTGRYTFPSGELNLNKAFDNYLIDAKVWGTNIRDYIANSGFNTSGVSLSNEFYLSTRSGFLPGTRLKLSAAYSRDSYHLFASDDPAALRKTGDGYLIASILNEMNRALNYGIETGVNILSADERNIRETNINSQAHADFIWNDLSFGGKLTLKEQMLRQDSVPYEQDQDITLSENHLFYSGEGHLKITPAGFFNLSAGIAYYAVKDNSLLAPFGSLECFLGDRLTFYAEYRPAGQFLTLSDFLKKNVYLNFGDDSTLPKNLFEKRNIDFNVMLKYEYDKYITVALSGGYSHVDNYPYYEDLQSTGTGKFDLLVAPEAKIFSSKLDFYYYTDVYGCLMGNATYSDSKDPDGHRIPYDPRIKSTLIYGYNLPFGFGFKASYTLAYDVVTNPDNSEKLGDYHDISLALHYELWRGFKITADFQNILNRSNFVWRQYQEKPFDMMAGVEYSW